MQTSNCDMFQIEKFGLNSVDVKEILLEMRKYRMGLIQTPEQLKFSYQAIIEGAKQLSNPQSNANEVTYFSLSPIIVINPYTRSPVLVKVR